MNAPLLWFLLGLVFLFVELLAPTLVLVFFGAGAWVTACAALLGLPPAWQLVLFILVSLLTLLLLRRHLRAVFGGRAQRAADADEACRGHKRQYHYRHFHRRTQVEHRHYHYHTRRKDACDKSG